MQIKWSYILWFSILTSLWGALGGCQRAVSPQKYRIGFSQCCGDPWRDVMEREMNRELAFHPELDFDIMVAGNDSRTQVEQIRELLGKDIDLLIVSPNESIPLTPIIEEVYRSGIPVILIDRKTESELYTAFIGADNYEIGATAADYISSQFPEGVNLIELQLGMAMSPAQGRSRGFQDALRKFPEMETVAQIEMTVGMAELKVEFLETLQQHPEAQAIFAHSDFLAENAYRWAQEIGKADELFFLGIDGIPGLGKGIQAVEDDVLDASLLYPTGGAEAIQLALAILNNLPYEKNNTLQTIVINKNNARILHLQMKKVESLQRSIDGQLEAIEDLNQVYLNQRVYIFILVLSLVLAIVSGGILLKSLKAKEEMNKNLEAKNREVLEQQRQIVTMSEKLKEATQAKMDFFTKISHEFRTPLTLILGYIEGMLARSSNRKADRQDLDMVRRNALRLLRLINQLMDFRKTESGKMTVRASENDLVVFAREIMEAFRKMADKRNIDLGFFTAEKELLAWFDVNMMDKVLFNLLSNAFKATPDGGKIHMGVVKDPIAEMAIIKVEDNGRGMAKEEAERVFEQFYQAGSNRSGGTGLGLSLSKELVGLHSGEITVWSEPAKGTRFEVSLPLGATHLSERQKAGPKPDSISYDELAFLEEEEEPETAILPAGPTSAEHTLLVVEDNESLRFFIKRHFGNAYHIREAADGSSGLDMALEEIPDLIIADIMMPGRDGLELAKILKTDLRTSHIPIVLLTAQSGMDQKIQGIQTGADAYVTKPFNLAFLSEVIKNLLHGRQALKDRFSAVIQPGQLPAGMGNLDEQFLRKFTQYVEAHYDDQNLTVENLSEAFGLSRVQLYRKVKALLGESVNDYIQQVRLRKASQLLLEGALTVAEIAYRVGYSSPGYFSTAFKGKYACSPSEYREKKSQSPAQ